MLQNTEKFQRRPKNYKNKIQVLAGAGHLGIPNEKKKPVEVHDFRAMGN